MIVYDEPRERGDYRVYLTRREAINLQREYAVKKYGYDIYENDEGALWDFKLIYGDWETDNETNIQT